MLFEPPTRWFGSVGSMAMSVSLCGPASLLTLTFDDTSAVEGSHCAPVSNPRFRGEAEGRCWPAWLAGVKRLPNAGAALPKLLTAFTRLSASFCAADVSGLAARRLCCGAAGADGVSARTGVARFSFTLVMVPSCEWRDLTPHCPDLVQACRWEKRGQAGFRWDVRDRRSKTQPVPDGSPRISP